MIESLPPHPFSRISARGIAVAAAAGLVPAALFAAFGHWPLARDVGFMTIVVYACLGAALHGYARLRGVVLARVYGPPPAARDMLSAVGFGLATIGLNVGLLALLSGLVGLLAPAALADRMSDENTFMFRQIQALGPVSRALLGIGIALFAPWIEEFIFRGLLFTRWARKFGLRTGVFASAAVFGALHFTTSPFTAFLIGIALAVLYARTGSLWVPIAAHMTNNGFIYAATLLLGRGAGDSAALVADSARGEAGWLIAGGVLLVALVLPFYVRTLRRWWPAAGAPLPYDRDARGADTP